MGADKWPRIVKLGYNI